MTLEKVLDWIGKALALRLREQATNKGVDDDLLPSL